MIYILSGIAKSGKTLLSIDILAKYKIPALSTDSIMIMLANGINKLEIDIDAEDSVVAKKLEPYLYQLIKKMIENNETQLIEGVHFNPAFSRKLLNEFGDKIRIIYLGYKDISKEDKVAEVLKYKDVMNNPWLFNHLNQSLEEIISYMIHESTRIYNECTSNGLVYIDVHNINIQKDSIIKALIEESWRNKYEE